MRKICILGGGAALAQPLIERWLKGDNHVRAYCNVRASTVDPSYKLTVCWDRPGLETGTNLLVTLPGTKMDAKIGKMTEGEWDRVITNTLSSVGKLLTGWGDRLADGANVVVVGSIAASLGGYGCANYAAAKAGLVGLVRAAANELAQRDICVNLLELGYIDAGMCLKIPEKIRAKMLESIPLKRWGIIEDFVGAVDYLSTVRYMTGNILTLAGGLR